MTDPTLDTRPWAILLMGPTASGKTDLAIRLAERLPCEIISVDSAMIYRGLDIGTAKPDPEILARAPHRLIDILDPTESYSTARFREDALAAMTEISARGRIPLLVGGTMLYFRALQQGLARLPSADAEVRAELEAEAERLGWAAMHARLAELDPDAARRIHPNDPQRIQRALEVQALSGRAMSDLIRDAEHTALPFRLLKLVRAPGDRAILHARIEHRFRVMLELGLVDEVSRLWARGDLTPDLPSMRCVGYRQVLNYLLGESTWEDMVQRGIIATRQLAKRQMTWLRAEPDCHWLDDEPDPLTTALRLIASTLKDEGQSTGSPFDGRLNDT
ncbi:tRNA dimethylallyltransferase [Allochromatium vinosum]|uniref:tRNA dimethylallyltransferase n=2 Tax=Allochromatium vinosum TaxID=1049 RepID=D3RSK3_ALLVD|nr:tRNA delta(2)-isopentenylpyrophosphate transferase [Allochromatium vinosum DSM 180]MBK1653618.1 tRNA dimethylallyltransferase [Allochromatium vinosum]